MKFSVLVPVYNVEQYIEECIQSILAQTYPDFEMILVDDGSTDNSGIICDKFAEKYFEKIRVVHKKNQGLISARRIGIDYAQGEFCVFVDSDDFVEADLLETIHEKIKGDLDLDILLYSFSYFRNGKRAEQFRIVAKDGEVWEGSKKKEVYEKLATSSDITSLCTKAIRTSLLKQDKTDYSDFYGKNMAEDLLQSLFPVSAARKVMYTSRSLYNYRIVDNSTSHQMSLESMDKKNTIHVYDKIMEYLPLMDMCDGYTEKRINAKWFNDTMYIMANCYESAKTWIDRKQIIEYEWEKMLPESIRDTRNEYENVQYKKLYSFVKNRQYFNVRLYFWKKKIYGKWKKIRKSR